MALGSSLAFLRPFSARPPEFNPNPRPNAGQKGIIVFQRVHISYAILTIGFTLISLAMMMNGSAHAGNPAWPFVTAVRNLFLLAGLAVGVGVALTWLLAESAEKASIEPNAGGKQISSAAELEARREANRVAWEEQEKALRAREEERQREAELKEKREKELKHRAEEKRKNRSAEEAARSGLDDFL